MDINIGDIIPFCRYIYNGKRGIRVKGEEIERFRFLFVSFLFSHFSPLIRDDIEKQFSSSD